MRCGSVEDSCTGLAAEAVEDVEVEFVDDVAAAAVDSLAFAVHRGQSVRELGGHQHCAAVVHEGERKAAAEAEAEAAGSCLAVAVADRNQARTSDQALAAVAIAVAAALEPSTTGRPRTEIVEALGMKGLTLPRLCSPRLQWYSHWPRQTRPNLEWGDEIRWPRDLRS